MRYAIALLAFLIPGIALAHDGPYQEWCEQTANGVVCVPMSQWTGRWHICTDDGACNTGEIHIAEPYKPICEHETTRQLDGNLAERAKQGLKVTSYSVECMERLQ